METPDFRARLRRLRREVEARPSLEDEREEGLAEERADERAELPGAIARRLARARDAAGSREEPLPDASTDPPRALAESATPLGPVLARTHAFPLDHRHGEWALDELRHARVEDWSLLTGDARLGELNPRRALFLDTETTGLSGGAGTYVFLIGLGAFTERGFELWQGFLRDPSEERALLADCAERIAASGGVVSFFGKAFDRHRLEDKMRLHGVEPPFEAVPHLDLYHPLRRLYRGSLEDSRLRTLERALCGVEREDDLPGAFAPAAWFDYLAGRPHRLEGVFRHNADDVLSLVTLAAHLGRASDERRAAGEPLAGDPHARAEGVARSLVLERRHADALSFAERALERVEPGPAARNLRLLRAELVGRLRPPAEALDAWRALAAEPEDAHTPGCFAQVARLLARARRADEARECCRVARALLARYADDPRRRRLEADLARIEARIH